MRLLLGYTGAGFATVDDGYQHTSGSDVYREPTAVASGTATVAYVYISSWDSATEVTVAVYDMSGNLIAESGKILSTSGTGLKSAKISASISAGTQYRLVLMTNGYAQIRGNGNGPGWETYSEVIGTPGAAPASFSFQNTGTSSGNKEFIIYLSDDVWFMKLYNRLRAV